MKSLEKRFKDIFDEYNELPDDAMRFKLDVLRVQEFTEELLKAVEDYYKERKPKPVIQKDTTYWLTDYKDGVIDGLEEMLTRFDDKFLSNLREK